MTTRIQGKPNPIFIGQHPSVMGVRRIVAKAAKVGFPVLITGETGTGKELLAREVHQASSRASGPFVVVDCGILAREVARSELFGHVRGAFTGAVESKDGLVEEARGGTLFLDEVGELTEPLQRHLLRLVQEGEYRSVGSGEVRQADVRVIAATHRDLEAGVEEGWFREDLFYRLNVLRIQVPPLRDRITDLTLLIEHFTKKLQRDGFNIRPFSVEARAVLERYSWPGNVRELAHVIVRAFILAEGNRIRVEDLPEALGCALQSDNPDEFYQLSYKEARKRNADLFVREYLHRALLSCEGNVTYAAKRSGIGRQYFQLRMAEHGLQAGQYRRRKYY